jgi:hypothetical protein
MRRLTLAEVEALPDGTRVYVKWSGGNGPFWYVIRDDKWGGKTINSEYRNLPSVVVDSVSNTTCIGLKEPSTTVDIEDE